jgi:hypothetical protein
LFELVSIPLFWQQYHEHVGFNEPEIAEIEDSIFHSNSGSEDPSPNNDSLVLSGSSEMVANDFNH